MESPARKPEAACRAGRPTRCRYRLGPQHGGRVRIAPEARDCLQEGPGLPQVWPYRLITRSLGPCEDRSQGGPFQIRLFNDRPHCDWTRCLDSATVLVLRASQARSAPPPTGRRRRTVPRSGRRTAPPAAPEPAGRRSTRLHPTRSTVPSGDRFLGTWRCECSPFASTWQEDLHRGGQFSDRLQALRCGKLLSLYATYSIKIEIIILDCAFRALLESGRPWPRSPGTHEPRCRTRLSRTVAGPGNWGPPGSIAYQSKRGACWDLPLAHAGGTTSQLRA